MILTVCVSIIFRVIDGQAYALPTMQTLPPDTVLTCAAECERGVPEELD